MERPPRTYGQLPAIPEYDVDAIAWRNMDRVGWVPHVARCALLVHDMQLFYIDSLPAGPADRVVGRAQGLIETAHSLGVPVIYSVAAPSRTVEDRGLLRDFHGMGMRNDPRHYEIHPTIAPRPSDFIVTKRIYSAFYETGLDSLLRSIDRTELLIAGVYADIGCQLTAFDAFKRGVKPFYVADAMVAYTESQHVASAEHVARLCAAIYTSSGVIDVLSGQHVAEATVQ